MSKENTFTRAIQGKWPFDQLALGKVRDQEIQTPMYAFNAGVKHIGGQNRADFFKSLRESAKSAVRALFADFF